MPKSDWKVPLPASVTAKVLQIDGTEDLAVAAIVFLTPKDFKICKSKDKPVALAVVEHTPKGGKQSELYVRVMKTEIRAGLQPEVDRPDNFATTRAFFVKYKYRTERETCTPSHTNLMPGDDDKTALFKLGRKNLAHYKTYTTSSETGGMGLTMSDSTSLDWYPSKNPRRYYLAVVAEKSRRIINTGGGPENERFRCSRSVAVIVMQRGKYWWAVRGKKLRALRSREPSLSEIKKNMRGGSRAACGEDD